MKHITSKTGFRTVIVNTYHPIDALAMQIGDKFLRLFKELPAKHEIRLQVYIDFVQRPKYHQATIHLRKLGIVTHPTNRVTFPYGKSQYPTLLENILERMAHAHFVFVGNGHLSVGGC